MEKIIGYIDSIVYSVEESGFTVARLKEPRKKELTTVVGKLPSVQPGETLVCSGEWKRHVEHGVQFEVQSFECRAPADLIGIQKYLESGLIKGIGAVYAKRIVEKFGLKTLDMIDQNPKLLLEVEGIGKKRLDTIESCWQQQRSVREVMIFLRSHNVSPSFAQKIFKKYGDQSIEKVKANPYALAKEIFGIGFASADAIAANIGIEKDSPVRIAAALEHLLWQLSTEGHVCYPYEELIVKAGEILSLERALIEKELQGLIAAGAVIQKEELVFVRALFLAELGIARELARLGQSPCWLRKIDAEKAIVWVQERLRLRLAKEQKEAVCLATSKKLHIITGGPGTGKSTITKAILAISEKLTGKILLAAPTGRAAKRMSEITKRKAFTIHVLLEMNFKQGKFRKGKEDPLDCDLIIIDEASMIDTQLMNHLLRAIPDRARVIFIGDVDQLPSVGPGNVLKNLIESECIEVSRLKRIFRQAAGSRIIVNAHKVNHGFFPDLEPVENSDFLYIEKETPEEIAECIVELTKKKIPEEYRFHKFDEIQVLSPMKRGIIGSENLNVILQKSLNPSPDPLMRMGKTFHRGDKVMQMRNNYQKGVFNGDVGTIRVIDTIEQQIEVLFDGRAVFYDFMEIDEIVLAYAVSIHKYQGSECPCIIIPIHTTHFKLLFRNLLYTGITRGKKLVILVGTKKAIAIAIRNDEIEKRYTRLVLAMREFNPILTLLRNDGAGSCLQESGKLE
jgi:exodeoxyribonuclease V alpha subunit